MAALEYLESVGSTSPNSAGFSLEGGRAVGMYLLQNADSDDLHQAITEIIGATSIDVGDGRLARTPPKAHPIYPWLFAESISNIKGIGPNGLATAADALENVTITTDYQDYKNWLFTVEFKTRAYPIAPDSAIAFVNTNYFDQDDNAVLATYPMEWDRYTDFDYIPRDDNNVTAKMGDMKFKTTLPMTCGPKTAPYSPSMYLPDMILKVIWYAVPYRYITSPNSYITQFRGKINYNELTICGEVFNPGELLYQAFSVKKYTPPVQAESLFAPGVLSTQKICDITFTFLRTDRIGENLPTTIGTGPGQKSSFNAVVAGHNLLPWLPTRKYYYAEGTTRAACTGVTGAKAAPSWLSTELGLLQADPDA